MRHYDALTFHAPRPTLDLIIAVSGTLPITGVLDEENSITLYFDEGVLDDGIREQIAAWIPDDVHVEMQVGEVEEQNWNAEFEESLEPVWLSDDLVITQSWHPIEQSPNGPLTIIIDPKMSFGTGHHESTRLIARL